MEMVTTNMNWCSRKESAGLWRLALKNGYLLHSKKVKQKNEKKHNNKMVSSTETKRLIDRSIPSGQKAPLRHLRIFFNLSYLDKKYIGCLQGNWIAPNCKNDQKCLVKISNNVLLRCLRQAFQRHLWKVCSRRIFLKFKKRKDFFFYFYLIISCVLI